MSPQVDINRLIETVVAILPGIIGLIRGNHGSTNPEEPPPTDEQIIAALNSAVVASVGKDDALLQEYEAERKAKEGSAGAGGERT